MGHVGTISLRLETYQNLLADVLRSIDANGFHRLVLINGHGGNMAPDRAVTTQLAEENIFPISFSWWEAVRAEMAELAEADGGRVGHAGEWETSVQLHLRPHLVDRSRMVADTDTNPFSEHLQAWAWYAERRRDSGQATGVHGNPLVASAAKGERVFKAVVEKLVQLVTELHHLPVRQYRELGSHCP